MLVCKSKEIIYKY